MKKISIRNLIIVLLCFTLIILAVAFSIISAQLEGYKKKVEKFQVSFTEVAEDSSIKGGVVEPSCKTSISDEGYTLNMDFTLNNPQDEISYLITIKNTGTMKAKIVDVVSSPDYMNDKVANSSIKPITVTKTDISGMVLAPEEETTFKVLVIYNDTINKGIKKVPYKLSLITTSVK